MSNEELVLTISREYGSNGLYIGEAVASKLGVACYDKQLIERTAETTGISEKTLESSSESVKSTLAQLFSFTSDSAAGIDNMPAADRIFLAESSIIREVADEGSCIIVGRCADYVLSERPNVVNIFFFGTLEKRIERIAEINGITPEEAAAEIRKVDKGRRNHYQHYTDRKWGNASNYDLCICTDDLSVDDAANLVVEYLRIRGKA